MRLSVAERRVLELLTRRTAVSTEQLCDLLWGDDPEGGPENGVKTVHVYLCHIRAYLKPHGIFVFTLDCEHFGALSRYGIARDQRPLAAKLLEDHDETYLAKQLEAVHAVA
jgi:hypothetical protein